MNMVHTCYAYIHFVSYYIQANVPPAFVKMVLTCHGRYLRFRRVLSQGGMGGVALTSHHI